MSGEKNNWNDGLSNNRLEALTDGIFAIAMTILVLAIDIPASTADMVGSKLHTAILQQSVQLLAYGLSFILLALFWTINHRQSSCFKKTDNTHIWINIIMLVFVCLVPYTTSLNSDFPNDWMANLYFNVNILIIGVLCLINWGYATKNRRLIYDDIPAEKITTSRHKSIIFVAIAILASISSFIIPAYSSFIYFLIPVMKFANRKRIKV